MNALIEDFVAVPSYNGYVIAEKDDMAPTLDQYWSGRKEAYREAISRLRTLATDEEAERVWRSFCRHQTSFLQQILRDGSELAQAGLSQELGWTERFARDTKRIFVKDAKAELWIPLDHNLQRVVRVPGVRTDFDVIDCRDYDGPQIEAGKAIVAVRWRQQPLFVLLPSHQFGVLDTFLLTMDHDRWNTEDTFQAPSSGRLDDTELNSRERSRRSEVCVNGGRLQKTPTERRRSLTISIV